MAANKDTDLLPTIHGGLLLPALLAAAVWLGGAHLLQTKVIAEHSRQQVQSAAQQQADQSAAILQQFFKLRAEKLSHAATDTANHSPISSGSNLLPQASVQFFTTGQLRVGAGHPALNFALVDLLKRAREQSDLLPEFLPGNSEKNQWQLHSAVALPEGVLLVTQPFGVFARELDKLNQREGAITIYQQFPDGPARPIWQSSTDNSGNGSASAAVNGSYLKVMFSPSQKFAISNGVSPRWSYIVGLLGLLVSLLLIIRLVPRNSAAPWEKSAGKNSARSKQTLQPDDLSKQPVIPKQEILPQQAAAAPRADEAPKAIPGDSMPTPSTDFPAHVFRAYDIRGIAGSEINEPFAYQLGRALGTLAQSNGERILLVGRDSRNSSELLSNCLTEGILDSGCNTVDLGLIPSPLLYYACARGKNANSGVMVTASHNPAEYNGFKIVLDGRPLADEQLTELFNLMKNGPFKSGEASNRRQSVSESYIEDIYNDVALAGQPHIVIDAGNGATSELAPELFEQLGCRVEKLFCEFDGNFPNHPPDPSRPENLQALIQAVQAEGADLGVALDGDGDRVTLISASGRIAWADQLVMLLARDILARNPGSDIVFDVKSSRALSSLVSQYGGRPVMWKTGHAPMKTKMLETGAVLGGELSGHIFIKDRWYGFDDGTYAAARVLEIMALREQSLDELLDSLPQMVNTPEILLPIAEDQKFNVIAQLQKHGNFGEADINTIDGLRIEFADGWGLVRASNTGAALTLRFEAETNEALNRIRTLIAAQLNKIDPALVLPG